MVESLMHDKGYTYFDLPRLHYGEMRRLAEGIRIQNVLERDAVEENAPNQGGAGMTDTTQYQRMRSASKGRAIERFKENKVRN